jgi:hypothetical protein
MRGRQIAERVWEWLGAEKRLRELIAPSSCYTFCCSSSRSPPSRRLRNHPSLAGWPNCAPPWARGSPPRRLEPLHHTHLVMDARGVDGVGDRHPGTMGKSEGTLVVLGEGTTLAAEQYHCRGLALHRRLERLYVVGVGRTRPHRLPHSPLLSPSEE